MEIKASCTNDIKAIKALADIQMYKKKNPKKTFTARAVFFSLMIILLWLFAATTSIGREIMPTIVIITAVFVLWLVTALLIPRLSYRNNGKLAETVNQYTFTDSGIEVESRGEGHSSDASIMYENIDRVYETSDYIFVYINKLAAYVVDKKTISSDDITRLKEKIISAAGKKKYIVCKY